MAGSYFFFDGTEWDLGQLAGRKLRNGYFSGDLGSKSLNGGHLAGFRNKIANGGCAVIQGGNYTFTGSAGFVYAAVDGMLNTVSATTVSAIATSSYVGLMTTGEGTGYATSLANVTTTGATTVSCGQRVEHRDGSSLGSVATYSAWVYQDTGLTLTANCSVSRAAAGADNFSGNVALAAAGNSVPSGVWTKVKVTTPALVYTDAQNGLECGVTYSGIAAVTNKNFYFTNFQLEPGPNDTPFENRPVALDAAACRRQLYVSRPGVPTGGVGGAVGGVALTASGLMVSMKYPELMRITPATSVWNNGVNNQYRNTGTGATVNAGAITSLGGHNPAGFSYLVATNNVFTVGSYYDFDIIADARL